LRSSTAVELDGFDVLEEFVGTVDLEISEDETRSVAEPVDVEFEAELEGFAAEGDLGWAWGSEEFSASS